MGNSAHQKLVGLLTHPEPEVRRFVANELAAQGWQPTGDAESACFLAAKGEYGEAANLGEVALSPLTLAARTLGREHEWKLERLIPVLKSLGAPAAPALVAIMNDSSLKVSMAAAQALDEMGWSAEDEDVSERMAVLRRLAEVDRLIKKGDVANVVALGAEAVLPLIAFLNEPRLRHNDEIELVIKALKAIGDPRAFEPLLSFCDRRNSFGYAEPEQLRIAAEKAWLGLVDLRVAEEIVLRLERRDLDHTSQQYLSRKLIVYPPPQYLPSYHDSFAYRAHQALLNLSGEAVPPLLGLLENDSHILRKFAADTLGEIGDARAVEPLIRTLADRYGIVIEAAAEALARIGDARAVEPLTRMLGDYNMAYTATKALSGLGDLRAVETLAEVLVKWTRESRDLGPLWGGLLREPGERWARGVEALTPLGAAVVERLQEMSAHGDNELQPLIEHIFTGPMSRWRL